MALSIPIWSGGLGGVVDNIVDIKIVVSEFKL